MTHEMTHAIQIGMGSFSGGWIRTIGTMVLTEGLAMRVTQKLNPGVPSTKFVEGRPGWLAEADSKRIAILQDVQSVLSSKDADDVMRYTIGKGRAGIEREAYYAGWLVVDYWLRHGMSFADIARIPEAQMPVRVGDAIQKLLAESSPNERRRPRGLHTEAVTTLARMEGPDRFAVAVVRCKNGRGNQRVGAGNG